MDDRAFLHGLNDNPADRQLRGLYADWLDERGDPRGEYFRVEELLESLEPRDPRNVEVRARMLALRGQLPADWIAAVRPTVGAETDIARLDLVEQLATHLGRPIETRDAEGFAWTLQTGAIREDRLAWLESRYRAPRRRNEIADLSYYLRIRSADGRHAEWRPTTRPPYGCLPRYLQWFGDTVVFLYETHGGYGDQPLNCIVRFGIDFPAKSVTLHPEWRLEGLDLFTGVREFRERTRDWRVTEVHWMRLPELKMKTLSLAQAASWGIMPRLFPPRSGTTRAGRSRGH